MSARARMKMYVHVGQGKSTRKTRNNQSGKTTMKTIRLIALFFLFIAVTVPAYGNTRFGFGTIVDVDADGSRSKGNVAELHHLL